MSPSITRRLRPDCAGGDPIFARCLICSTPQRTRWSARSILRSSCWALARRQLWRGDLCCCATGCLRALAEAHGFSAIAFESSFPRARLVNEYVAGSGPAAYEAVQENGWSHGFGRF